MAPWGIAQAWWLAAGLVAGIALVFVGWRRGPRARVGGVAAAACALLFSLGLAQPWVREARPQDRLIVLAVDVSDSVGPLERLRAAQLVRAAWEASAPARRAVIAFGADATMVVAPGEPLPQDLDAALASADVATHASHADPAIGLAATLRRRDEPAHCVLYSDGALQRDDPLPPPLPVSTVALSPEAPTNAVRCEALEGPDVAEAGAPVALAVRYHAAAPARAEVVVTDGLPGTEVVAREACALLPGGPHLLSVPALMLAAGSHVLTAEIRLTDPVPEDNAAALALQVLEPPPVALATTLPDGAGAQTLQRALAAQGLPLRTVSPEEVDDALLADVRVLIWDAPDAAGAAGPVGTRVAAWVRRGGGLIVTTGMESTPGDTDFGRVLPAEIPKPPPPPPEPDPPPTPEPPPDPPPDAPPKPKTIEFVPVGMVLVVDKSGSMQGRKIQLAREAAIAMLDTLAPGDRFGVVAFDDETRWVVHPAEGLSRAQAVDRISRLASGGGTNIYPAISAARDALRDLRVGARHVVLLSDGQDENVRDYRSLVESMARHKMTLSTIGVGEAFDQKLLTLLAGWGNGRFDFTESPDRVPALVTARTRWAIGQARPTQPDAPAAPEKPPPGALPPDPPTGPPPPDAPPEQPETAMPVTLRLLDAHPITSGLGPDPWPALTALRTVEPRPATLTLTEGIRADGPMPALVLGHAGAGRVLLLACDLDAEAASELGHWSELPALLAQAVRFLGPPPVPPFSLEGLVDFHALPADPSAPTVAQIAWRAVGDVVPDDATLEATVRVGDAEPISVTPVQTAPDRWEAQVPAPPPGGRTIWDATLRRPGEAEPIAAAQTATLRGAAPERLDAPDGDALRELAAESGGWFGPNADTIATLVPIPEHQRSVAWIAWLLAVLCLLPVAWGQQDE